VQASSTAAATSTAVARLVKPRPTTILNEPPS
jgi:hypothetical protein